MDAHEGTSYKEKMENLKSECERLGKENENLRLMLEVMSDQYNILQSRLQKVKEEEQEFLATKPSKVFVRTNSNDKTLVVKDGCQWRKYGQKVTKDNPSPRAYFRCSMAPSCPVKNKVQRSMEDESVLMVTYEGEHNHAAATDSSTASSQLIDSSSSIKGSTISFPCSSLMATPFPPPTTGLNLTFTRPNQGTTIMPTHNLMHDYNATAADNDNDYNDDDDNNNHNHNSIICTKIGECMAHLTKDSNFTAALAAAVAHSISQQLKPNST